MSLLGQNPEGFEEMLDGMYEHTVKQAKAVELAYLISSGADITILDAREAKECATSGIKGAICVGYDDFDVKNVKDLPKDKPVYVYCSIGYRSERVGEQLQDAGFERVFNLYGGIFDWANHGNELYDANGELTKKVHGFDEDWSQWLNENRCDKRVD